MERNLTGTGRYLYESFTLDEHESTPEDEKWQLMFEQSEKNLCDRHGDDDSCETTDNRYYTDDQWAITFWCEKHLNQLIKDGTFVEVKE